MKAEDYISFIEQGRRDKISPDGLDLIAKTFRELELEILNQSNFKQNLIKFLRTVSSGYGDTDRGNGFYDAIDVVLNKIKKI